MRCLVLITLLLLGACKPEASAPKACHDSAAMQMIRIQGGVFTMGEDPYYPEEGPAHLEQVDDFWIDAFETTNAEFAKFVKATGDVTVAERAPPRISGALPEMLLPGSAVFSVPGLEDAHWWRWVAGADWRHPA
ncbi:MAG: SUMF1/EgtB/PvdO family nonheme iron enzyme, partial [Alphaproteobacteria bacterium]